jgi:cyclase
MKVKKILTYAGVLVLALILAGILYMYPYYRYFFTTTTVVLDPGLTLYQGGGNSCILDTDSALLVIDTKMSSMAKDLRRTAVEQAGTRPVIVINTHFHGDHIYGNDLYRGCKIYMGGSDTAEVRRHIAREDMPTDFVKDSLVLKLGNEEVVMLNLGQAHSFADMVVYLRNRKTLIAGDLVVNKVNPVLMKDDGAGVDQWLKALEKLENRWMISRVVPGHGKAGGYELLQETMHYFRDMRLAYGNPSLRPGIRKKYSDWMAMPFMSSPRRTISFIRAEREQ